MKKYHGTFQVYFTCYACEYQATAFQTSLCVCNNPEVEKMGFEGNGLETYTKEDYIKLDKLVNDIMQLKINRIGPVIPNFDWPFRYEPIWIYDCKGFKEKQK